MTKHEKPLFQLFQMKGVANDRWINYYYYYNNNNEQAAMSYYELVEGWVIHDVETNKCYRDVMDITQY